MPKTPSNKLFNLVKSLSGPEKRYFKVFVNGQGSKESKYLQLFDAIDTQEEFDDEALKELVYGGEPIQSRKYSELKAYLYDLILKSLQFYDEKSSVGHRLKNMMQGVRVLFRRSLFDDCKDHLAKARKLAYRYEQFNTVLEALDWEKRIAYAETDIDFLDEELSRIAEEESQVLEQLRVISGYRNIFFRLLVSLRKHTVFKREEQKKMLSEVMQSPLMQDYGLANSHTARVIYHRIYSIYHFAASDLQGFYSKNQGLIALMESEPHMLQEDVSEYISALSNLIRSCGEMGRLDEMEENLEKLYGISPRSLDDELKIHRQYYQAKLSLCMLKGTFDEGIHILNRHLKERRRFEQSLFESHTFYYIYFYLTFGAGEYSRALDFLNQWLSLPSTVERQDLQSLSRILNLMVHYELGNFELLESLIRSAYRFLKKRNELDDMVRNTITLIRKLVETPSKKMLKEDFNRFKKQFEGLSQQAGTPRLYTNAVIAWFESKIEGRGFSEILQEEFSRQFQTGA
ncbi:MAG: hypothetical protein KDD06_04350 [Phaeodactylibacter sp.]|nr:hypothetical protein [Phaeodactylibacter sp.]MCB9266219.1 hypothetical protein [Lewinellaceae bacterium]